MASYPAQLRRTAGKVRRATGRTLHTVASKLVPAPQPPAPAEPVAVVDAPAPPPPSVVLDTAPARPLPEGWDEAKVHDVMASFRVDGSDPGELKPYADDALWRFLHTWGLVRDERGPALELGGNPYFITWLLRDFTDLDVTVANYFGGPAGTAAQEVEYEVDGEARQFTVEYDSFNLEEDRFPYEDGSFKVVLFCEIIEHLLMDPLHALREINRVLEPGGLFVLTTPNVARIGNVLAMLVGGNIYDPYSGHGPYGRHNREFTRHELDQLLGFAGFGDRRSFTGDAHPADFRGFSGYDLVAPTLAGSRADDLGQYHFFAVRKTGEPRPGLPTAFYRSWPADQLVEL